MLGPVESEDSPTSEITKVWPGWDGQASSVQFGGSAILSEEANCVEEAISCSKTDFGHFAHVLDNGQGSPFGTLWEAEHSGGTCFHSSRDGVLAPGLSNMSSVKIVSHPSVDSCSSASDSLRPCALDSVEKSQVGSKRPKSLQN